MLRVGLTTVPLQHEFIPVMGSVGVGGKTENKYKKDGLCEHQLVNKIAG